MIRVKQILSYWWLWYVCWIFWSFKCSVLILLFLFTFVSQAIMQCSWLSQIIMQWSCLHMVLDKLVVSIHDFYPPIRKIHYLCNIVLNQSSGICDVVVSFISGSNDWVTLCSAVNVLELEEICLLCPYFFILWML